VTGKENVYAEEYNPFGEKLDIDEFN